MESHLTEVPDQQLFTKHSIAGTKLEWLQYAQSVYAFLKMTEFVLTEKKELNAMMIFCDSICKQEKVYWKFASAAMDTSSSKGGLVEKGNGQGNDKVFCGADRCIVLAHIR